MAAAARSTAPAVSIQIHTAPGEAERLLIVGATRSGKTTLGQALLGPLGSWVVFDSKRLEGDWRPFAEAHDAVISENPADVRRHERVVIRIDTRSLQDRGGWTRPGSIGYVWTEVLLSVFWRQSDDGATVAVFDEAIHTLPVSDAHPEAIRMSSQGAGLGIPVWVFTQAPLYIDTLSMAMAEHCFAFATPHVRYRRELSLRRGVDCELLAELAGPRDPDVARQREFAHHLVGEDSWTRFSPLQLGRRRPRPEPVPEVDSGTPQDREPAPGEAETVTLTAQEEPAKVAP